MKMQGGHREVAVLTRKECHIRILDLQTANLRLLHDQI